MKAKILKTFWGILGAISFVCLFAVSDDPIKQILWSASWGLLFSLSAKGYERNMTDEEKKEKA
jgi:hypothetical protein